MLIQVQKEIVNHIGQLLNESRSANEIVEIGFQEHTIIDVTSKDRIKSSHCFSTIEIDQSMIYFDPKEKRFFCRSYVYSDLYGKGLKQVEFELTNELLLILPNRLKESLRKVSISGNPIALKYGDFFKV